MSTPEKKASADNGSKVWTPKESIPESGTKTPLFTIEETNQSDNHSDVSDVHVRKDGKSTGNGKADVQRITSGSSSGIGSKSSALSGTLFQNF